MIVGVSGSDRFPSLSWDTGHKMVIAVISVCCSADIAMHDVAEFVVLSVTWMYMVRRLDIFCRWPMDPLCGLGLWGCMSPVPYWNGMDRDQKPPQIGEL